MQQACQLQIGAVDCTTGYFVDAIVANGACTDNLVSRRCLRHDRVLNPNPKIQIANLK